MRTTNLSLPDSLKAFVDTQVSERGFGTMNSMATECLASQSLDAGRPGTSLPK